MLLLTEMKLLLLLMPLKIVNATELKEALPYLLLSCWLLFNIISLNFIKVSFTSYRKCYFFWGGEQLVFSQRARFEKTQLSHKGK